MNTIIVLHAPELRHVTDAAVPGEWFRFSRQSRDCARGAAAERAQWIDTKPARKPMNAASGFLYGLAAGLALTVAVMLAGCDGPTDTDAERDSAANVDDAIAAAVLAAGARK